MDYRKIYDDFIKDRHEKTKEWRFRTHKVAGYEWHHIIPRALGGKDEQSNLVALSYSDHIFAHCLLAKIHGGSMIIAVSLMSFTRKTTTNRRSRNAYSIFRSKFAELNSPPVFYGEQNNKYNPKIYHWVNLDSGEELKETLHFMGESFGARATFTSVANGYRNSVFGWCIKGTESERKRSYKGKSFRFENRDGRVFDGTQKQFCNSQSISTATASRIIRHGAVSKCGWRLAGSNDRNYFTRKNDGLSPRLGSGISYTIKRNEDVFTGKANECAEYIGCSTQQFHAGRYQIKTGKMKHYKGWIIENA